VLLKPLSPEMAPEIKTKQNKIWGSIKIEILFSSSAMSTLFSFT
jgi:hypothetical protein